MYFAEIVQILYNPDVWVKTSIMLVKPSFMAFSELNVGCLLFLITKSSNVNVLYLYPFMSQ